jgi:hypothetical protein
MTEGIAAELTARVATAPKVRFYPTGELVWEFNVRLDMDGRTETLTVRAPDQNYGSLQNWARLGALLFLRGRLRLVRWRNDQGQDKARLILEPLELMPLGTRIEGSAPAAMDYRDKQEARRKGKADPKLVEELQQMLDEVQP